MPGKKSMLTPFTLFWLRVRSIDPIHTMMTIARNPSQRFLELPAVQNRCVTESLQKCLPRFP